MIFEINHKPELEVGMEVFVSREKSYAYLPALRWGRDEDVDNILPIASKDAHGWFEVLDNGAVKQILRDPYNEEPKDMDYHILQTETHFVIGKIILCAATFAKFEVLYFAPMQLVWKLSEFVSHKGDKRTQMYVIRAAANFPETTLAWGDYRISFYNWGETQDWPALQELVEKLPHGSGWNGVWHIHCWEGSFDVSINYTWMPDVWEETVDVGWNVSKTSGKWVVGDDPEDLPEELNDLGDWLQEALNA